MSEAEHESHEQHRFREWGRRARLSAFWVSTTTIGWQLVSWVLTVLTANFLIPADYGVMSLAETLFPYFLLVSSFYSRTWIVQVPEFSERDGEAMMSYTTLLGLGASLGAFIVSPLVADFYGDSSLSMPFRVMAVGLAFRSVTTVSEAVLSRGLHYKELSMLTALIAVSRGVLQLVLAYFGFGFWSLVLGCLYRDLGTTIGLVFIQGLPRRFGWNLPLFRAALTFGVPATASALVAIVFASADRVIIGKLLGTQVLGFYAFAAYIADLPTAKLNMMFRSVLVSYFSRLKENRQVLAQQFLKICRVAATLIFPTLVGMAIIADDAVPLFLGAKWLPMITPLQVMSIVCLMRAFVDMVPPLLTSYGLPGRVLIYNLVSTTVVPSCMLLAVWQCGLRGAYLTWLVTLPLLSIFLLRHLRESLDIEILAFFKNVRAPFFASLCMGVVVGACGELAHPYVSMALTLALKIVFGVILYSVVLRTCFREQWNESVAMVRGMRGEY